ncbi:MAG TPA: MerR family DNA-binding protein [Actinomycetota bacterium]|nr:MerR family DNA-binding protein [Actinomycetota bacterium]
MRIGELAAAAGTTTKTLRFYEETGLLQPAGRTSTGYRQYNPGAVGRLDFIRRGRAAGLTLAQIREILTVRDQGHAPCQHVEEVLGERLTALDAQIADLQLLRDTVAQLHQAVSVADPDTCHADQVCRYL